MFIELKFDGKYYRKMKVATHHHFEWHFESSKIACKILNGTFIVTNIIFKRHFEWYFVVKIY